MAQVDHSKRDMVSTQEVGVFTVKADEQGSELELIQTYDAKT
jgi:hypothetical protein